MALTVTQKMQARRYLGWSARFHQIDTALEQALSAIDTDATNTAEVQALLVSCIDIDTKLLASHGRLKAETAGPIRLRGFEEIRDLRAEGKRFVQRLANILGVPILGNAFGMGFNADNFIGK